MAEDSSGPSPEQEILAEIFGELEARGDRSADVEELVRRHPALEQEIRELWLTRRALEAARPCPETPLPGHLGDFRIVRRLETGGMGDVYEAWQESLQRRVAIKVLRHGSRSPRFQERFAREQRVLAQLHQTNIVPIYAGGREGEVEFFAMPFIAGVALDRVLDAAAGAASAQPGARTPSLAELVVRVKAGHFAHEPTPPAPAFRPSREYLLSAARVIADAALAVQHAHDQGVLHRDLKPSNIMVEAHENADGRRIEQCWVIDFGLASQRGATDGAATQGNAQPRARSGVTPAAVPSVSGVMGTPTYMAPEQFDRRADERSDVWGLGVTLYEVLTLRRAFPDPNLVLTADPPRPRGLVPRDLEAICFKAIHKDPPRRYGTARELAEDLRRWRTGEPVRARLEQSRLLAIPLRCARWARRYRGWTAAIGVAVAAVVAFAAAGYSAAEERRRTTERAGKIQELEQACAIPRHQGWSSHARMLAREIARLGSDERSREAVSLLLAGLDAERVQSWPERTSALALDGSGAELLLGGAPEEPARPALPARAFALGAGAAPATVGQAAAGPVAYRADGTRVQFEQVSALHYRLWDVTRGEPLAAMTLACEDPEIRDAVRDQLHLPVLAIAADASVAAAAVTRPAVADRESDIGAVAAWETTSGRLLHCWPVRARALAISPDGRLIAAGDAGGRVRVWSLPQASLVAELEVEGQEIQALAFGSSPVGVRPPTATGPAVQLAVGCRSGRIEVFRDLAPPLASTSCRGMSHRVLALAFSPDGALLGAAGSSAMLWDSVTGDRVLTISVTVGNAIAFSSDGRRLAVGGYAGFGATGEVTLFELSRGRGMETLRGMDCLVSTFAFSADGRWLAGLTSDWRVAIWDLAAGALHSILEAPHGFVADNAGLAFDPSGTRLACMTGTEAWLWDVATGERSRPWQLPAGLVDQLKFNARGELIAARCEPAQSAGLPPERSNCIVHVRNLSTGEMLLPIPDFAAKVVSIALDTAAEHVVVEGDCFGPEGVRRRIAAFEIATGRELWRHSSGPTLDWSSLCIDPTGSHVGYRETVEGWSVVASLRTGAVERGIEHLLELGPRADTLVQCYEWGEASGVAVLERGSVRPSLRLRRETLESRVVLDAAGARLAWGNADGTVTLCDLAAIRRTVAALDP